MAHNNVRNTQYILDATHEELKGTRIAKDMRGEPSAIFDFKRDALNLLEDGPKKWEKIISLADYYSTHTAYSVAFGNIRDGDKMIDSQQRELSLEYCLKRAEETAQDERDKGSVTVMRAMLDLSRGQQANIVNTIYKSITDNPKIIGDLVELLMDTERTVDSDLVGDVISLGVVSVMLDLYHRSGNPVDYSLVFNNGFENVDYNLLFSKFRIGWMCATAHSLKWHYEVAEKYGDSKAMDFYCSLQNAALGWFITRVMDDKKVKDIKKERIQRQVPVNPEEKIKTYLKEVDEHIRQRLVDQRKA